MNVDPTSDAVEREAKRIYLRYAVEVIEALGFCPWARVAREEGRVALVVVRGEAPDLSRVLQHVLEADASTQHDVTIVLMPECRFDREALARFTASLRERYDQTLGRAATALAIADFHPGAAADVRSPERLVPFVRKSPDPTLQLVRHSALDAVRKGAVEGTRFVDESTLGELHASALEAKLPLSQRVAHANARTLERLGIEAVQALLDDIARDRQAAYSKAGVRAHRTD